MEGIVCAVSSCVYPERRCFLKADIDSRAAFLRRKGRKALFSCSEVRSTERQLSSETKSVNPKSVSVGVLGASGYTGCEIIRLLATHPYIGINLLTAGRTAGKPIKSVFPHLTSLKNLPTIVSIKDADFSKVDAVFCCLPHGTTQDIIKNLPRRLKIVDLSADFRLRDVVKYEEWYGQPHRAQELQKNAVYGLTEINRYAIQSARLVANPGCYPTSAQLPLIPLIQTSLIEREVIIDSKSGVSGAGRSAKESNLYAEVAEGMYSYGIANHRHVPEIEQGLSDAAEGSKIAISFTPHLIPMTRGMQSTIYVKMSPGVIVKDIYEHLKATYENEDFVKVLEESVVPTTRLVYGSNFCYINVFPDRIPGRAILISVIDNLLKGASGQALQNMNLMLGFPETTALTHLPLFP